MSTISSVFEPINVPGTVSGHLRSSVSHVRSVRKDDMLRQRHLHDRFLRAQVRSTLVIVNPECSIRLDKVTNHFWYAGLST